MELKRFKGFGGVEIAACCYGREDDPIVLLLPGSGETRESWSGVAQALASAGRHVVCTALRRETGEGLDACAGDLYAILAQLPSRPAIVGAGVGARVALVALGEGGPDLASALILLDDPAPASLPLTCQQTRLDAAAVRAKLPALVIHPAPGQPGAAQDLGAGIAGAERVEIEAPGGLVASEREDVFNAVLLEFLERRVPLQPPEFHAGSDARTLRDALGCFATGVTVVTALSPEGTPVGLTANSFTSVSLDPPLLLVCLANAIHSLHAFETAAGFAVNVLHIGQQPVSTRFASKGEDRFAATAWERWSTGAPIISGALASFECERHAMYDGGDHQILVGRVIRVRYEPRRDPLLYFRGKYRRLHFA
ncbi:MAG: flavin reductase [Acidocella sp. 20-63-7]|nr:MAG: flavin reductase [Acidocella sp. 20-63-7]